MLCSTILENYLRNLLDKCRECGKTHQIIRNLVVNNAFVIYLLPLQISKKYAKILLALTETFIFSNFLAEVNTKLLLNKAALFPFSATENVVGIVG